MPGACRLGDNCTGHDACPSRPLIEGSDDVIINNKKANRVGKDKLNFHGCEDHPSHQSVVLSGSPDVFVDGIPIGRKDDPVACGGSMKEASEDVIIN